MRDGCERDEMLVRAIAARARRPYNTPRGASRNSGDARTLTPSRSILRL